MATALETASLVMVPSGYEDGTLGSLQPLDGTGDFTFTRGSNISATRVNEAGYIEKGYENLVYYSNAFDAGTIYWDVRLINSIIGGQAGYDGSNDAWRLNRIAGEEFIRSGSSSNVTNVSGVHTCSIYAKANEVEWILFGYNGIGFTYFHLSGEGSLGNNVASVLSSSIESVGNGWYRCSFTANGTPNGIYVYPANGNGDLGGTGGVYIQDAQLNQGLAAYPYLETTTTTAKGGILEDMPRLDYSSGRCSLLLEPARTNLIEHSEYFGAYSGWYVNGGTLTSNAIISPSGLLDGSLMTNGDGNQKYILPSASITDNTDYSYSVFVKRGNDDIYAIKIFNSSFSESLQGQFNFSSPQSLTITDNVTGGSYLSSDVKDFGNGWYRIELSFTSFDTSLVFRNYIGAANGADNATMYYYGFQLEQGPYPTSYIPTYGVSQTRLRDLCTGGGDSNSINGTSGTMFFDFVHGYAMFGTTDAIGLQGSNGRIILYFSSNSIYGVVQIIDSIGTTTMAAEAFNDKTRYKIAVTYNTSEIKLYKNGVLQNTIRGVASDLNLNSLNLNAISSTSSGQMHNQALYFPTALSDEACIELTTI